MQSNQASEILKEMGIPLVIVPEDIDSLLNCAPDTIASIDDMDVANALQFKISQFILYVTQQQNIYKLLLHTLNNEYSNLLMLESSKIKPKSMSLGEKKALAIANNDELALLSEEVNELQCKRILLEQWDISLKNLLDVVKQVHFRLRLREFGM